MVNIVLRQGETIEEALRRFKRECEKHGILQEIKKREYYKPPSVVKKEKNNEIKRKLKRRAYKSSNPKKRRRVAGFKKTYSSARRIPTPHNNSEGNTSIVSDIPSKGGDTINQ